jgi:hypothetical protein
VKCIVPQRGVKDMFGGDVVEARDEAASLWGACDARRRLVVRVEAQARA